MKKTIFNSLFLGLIILCAILPTKTQAQGILYGVTSEGGADNNGVLFKTDFNGSLTVEKTFPCDISGAYPQGGLIQSSNGKLYGMTSAGGLSNLGVLFEYDPVNAIYINKFDFDGTSNGASPSGNLLQAINGKLYGMTQFGGANNWGVLFEFDPTTSTYTKIFDFNGVSNGASPKGSLIQANNGNLYGVTQLGGLNNKGVLFEFNPATSTYIKKLDFDGVNYGDKPNDNLIQASNSNLYGTTQFGGVNNIGVLFEYNITTSTYTKKLDFNIANNGGEPTGGLTQAGNGKLYGLTKKNTLDSLGVLFEYDLTTSVYTKKLEFDGNYLGSSPKGSLMLANNGSLYGMTSKGGMYMAGVLFEFNPNSSFYTKKIDFNYAANGANPEGSLMQANNGNLYGMTYWGGPNNLGVLFEFNTMSNIYTIKIDFAQTQGAKNLQGSLIFAPNNKMYGVSNQGGTSNVGVLFEYDPLTFTYSKKLDFNGVSTGAYPVGDLVLASNGNLYGMTYYGGASNSGILFEYDPLTNTFTKKLDFNGASNGAYPTGGLMQASNGKLYGMTYSGGTYNLGTFFEYDIATDTYTKKLNFNGTNYGSYPNGSVTQASNNNLYGMTSYGGTNDLGILFEYNFTANTFVKKLDFDGASNGSLPLGSLTSANNNKLYGMTYKGGTNNWGVLFEYDPTTNMYIKKLDFDGANHGAFPQGSLMLASNGKLYGMTTNGGAYGMGIVFEYNPNSSSFVLKSNFSGVNGAKPIYTKLIESPFSVGVKNIYNNHTAIQVYPNPTNSGFTVMLDKIYSKLNLQIINETGAPVYTKEFYNQQNLTLGLNLPKGIYMVKINTSEGMQSTTKVVVE